MEPHSHMDATEELPLELTKALEKARRMKGAEA
jgi:hypothetical protein